MRHRLSIPSLSLARSLRSVTITVALSMLLSLGWLVAPAPAAAQDEDELTAAGVDGDAYESPTYGYTVEWDGDVWEAVEAVTSDDGDFLRLSSLDIDRGDIYLEGKADFDGDVAACLDAAIASIENDDRVTAFEPLLDADDEPVVASGDVTASAAFTYVVTIDDEEIPLTQYFECRVLVEDEAVLQIDHLAPQDDYEAESELAADVIASLSVPGGDEAADSEPADDPVSVEAAQDDEDATATAEADDTDPTDEPTVDEPTPTTDDEDEEPTVEAEDAEPTEEPADDAEPTEAAGDEAIDPDDLEGVDDETYTAPTYGYTLEWDADLWSPREATSEDDVDTLVLSNDVSTVTLVGTAEFGENLDRCVRTARRGIEAGTDVEDVTPTLDGDGEPIEIDEDDRAGGVYSVFLDDPDGPPDLIAQIECRVAVPGDAVIQIVQVTEAADFNAEITPVRDVLDTITLQDEEPADDEPTPEDGEPANDQESAVDGNTYVSPNFGYTLEWDEDVWEFNPDDESSEPGFDTFFLESSASGVGIFGTDAFSDPETCVDDFASILRMEPNVDNWAPFEDEDGERVEGERDGGYFAAFSLNIAQTGQDFDLIYYLECRVVVEDESVVLFFMTTSPDAYDDATRDLDDLLDTLVTPGGEDDPEPTPTADADADAEPTPEDEDQDADADPTPTDEEDPDEDTASGADLDSYTDPDFPFTLSWDEGAWTVADQRTISDGHNLLNLTAAGSDLTIEGWARWDGVPTDCLNDITTNLRAIDGVEDFQRVSDTDRYPENASPSGAYALYSFTLAPEGRTAVDYIGYIECRTVVDGEAVVVLTLIAPADEYDALRSDFDPILASIEIDE